MGPKRLTVDRRFILGLAAAAAIGGFAWSGPFWRIGLAAVIPVLILTQNSRLHAALVAVAYFGASSWPIIPTATNFQLPVPAALWATASLLLSLPWLIAWSPHKNQAWWRGALALFLTAVPPLGIVGWASPLVSAGVLFPGTAWFGLAVVSMLPTLAGRRSTLLATILFAVAANLIFKQTSSPKGFGGIDTHLSPPNQPGNSFDNDTYLQTAAGDSKSAVTVLPEAVLYRWNQATEVFWEPTIKVLESGNRTALIGAVLPVAYSDQLRNALVRLGADAGPDLPPESVQLIIRQASS